VILKSYIVEKDFNSLRNYKAVLLYGENEGIKDDIKDKLKNLNKESEIINFFENDILKDKSILHKNIVNESLFNEKKKIFIHEATDKIYNEINQCLDIENDNTKIYVFSNSLEKRSKLRSLFEKKQNIATIACYEDNDRTLIAYITKELAGIKGLTGELTNLIISNSNSNRKIIKSELIKLKNFFDEKKINKKELLELLNIRNNIKFEEIRDNALTGKKNKVNKILSEIELLNEDSFFYLNILNYRVSKLIEIQTANEQFNNHEKTLENLKPPIFWKDKAVYLEQLKMWDLQKLSNMAYKIGETEVLLKKNSQVKNEIIIKDLIIVLSELASTSSSS